MTANQSAILVNNPHTKKAMVVLAKFAKKEMAYKQAEKEAKEATELIKEAMLASGVQKVTFNNGGFVGYITLAERTNYKAEDLNEVDEKYLKSALDTEKVKAQHTLTSELPAGVVETKTHYITKKFKAVE